MTFEIKARGDLVCHRDGSISYYHMFDRTWYVGVTHIPSQHLATLTQKDRDRAIRHLATEREATQGDLT